MDIKDVALKYLAARSRTSEEMKVHLLNKGFQESEVANVLETLIEAGYLNDLRYACDYISYATAKGRGRIRIGQELRHKGINNFTIEDAYYSISQENAVSGEHEISERERAMEEAKKIVEGREIEKKILGRVSRRLVSLGYDQETVFYVIGCIIKKEP